MNKEEYIQQVQDSQDYNKEVTMNGYKIRVGIRPVTFLALQELRNYTTETDMKRAFEKQRESFAAAVYVDFSIALENGGKLIPKLVSTPEDYSALIGQLNYLIKDNLYAYNSGDTLKALYCNYTNTYNNSKEIRLTYCFSRKAIEQAGADEICFEYRDELFGLAKEANFCFDKSYLTEEKVKIKGIQ